jgi:hypothetical protein
MSHPISSTPLLGGYRGIVVEQLFQGAGLILESQELALFLQRSGPEPTIHQEKIYYR